MKTLIALMAAMLVVGCETPLPHRPSSTHWEIKMGPVFNENGSTHPHIHPANGTSGVIPLPKSQSPLSFTELAKKDVVGSYGKGTPFKIVFSVNGMWEYYEDGKKKNSQEWKWSVVGKEVRAEDIKGNGPVYIIEPNGELKWIADFMDGERADIPKGEQDIFKKIK